MRGMIDEETRSTPSEGAGPRAGKDEKLIQASW